MTAGIFLLGEDNVLVKLASTPYDSEALLQELLENHPSLLAGTRSMRIGPDDGCWSRARLPFPSSPTEQGAGVSIISSSTRTAFRLLWR